MADKPKSPAQVIVRLKSHRRQSAQALPVFTIMLLAAVLVFVFYPGWPSGIIISLAAFAWLGDVANILYIDRKIKSHEQDPL